MDKDRATALPRKTDGFTDYAASADTRRVYVSTSRGHDSNTGLHPGAPVRSIARGVSLMRAGYADHLLFRRGDVWQAGLGQWTLSGRSSAEPMVIGAYGQGERPRFEFDRVGLQTTGAGGSRPSLDYLVFSGLHFLGAAHDVKRGPPAGRNPRCVRWLQGARDVRFEDMRFEYCQVTFQKLGNEIDGLRFFRSLFLDSFSVTGEHAQGIFIKGASHVSIEESIFDRCGWHPSVAAAAPTKFNHCVYWQGGAPADGVLRGNIIMRAASHGAQMRSSGTVEGNVFAGNAIGGFLAGDFDPPPVGAQGSLVGNVFTEGADITPREGHQGNQYRGWGWELIPGVHGLSNVVVRHNILAHCRSAKPQGCRSFPAAFPNADISDNIVWRWAGSQDGFVGNSPLPLVDTNRTLAKYNSLLGGEETFNAFAEQVRLQSRTNWRSAYTAAAIIGYFREGFAPAQ